MIACALALALLAPARFEPAWGARLPTDTFWRDESGRRVALRDCLAPGRPAVLALGYFRCPQLCSLVERSAVDALRPLAPTIGRDFEFIYLSIDPTDTPEAARAQRAAAIRAYGRSDGAAGWHYLTGPAASIAAVAGAAGFRFRFDPVSRLYAHPAGFLVLTPQGAVSGYFTGLDFPPTAIAAALRTAGAGRTGPPTFNLLLECFRGGAAGPRQRLVWRMLWIAVAATVAALALGIGWMLREERKAPVR